MLGLIGVLVACQGEAAPAAAPQTSPGGPAIASVEAGDAGAGKSAAPAAGDDAGTAPPSAAASSAAPAMSAAPAPSASATPPPTAPATGLAWLPSGPAKSSAERVLAQAMSGMRACYRRALASNPSMSGSIEDIRIRYDAHGVAKEVRVKAKDLPPGLVACVKEVLLRVPLAPDEVPKGGWVPGPPK